MYSRVIPRDLFNEANLLKCYGQLYLCLDHLNLKDVSLEHDGDPFTIEQNPNSGGISIDNVFLLVRGESVHLERPLNSRYAWPLYATTSDDNLIEVFTDTGELTEDMLDFLVS